MRKSAIAALAFAAACLSTMAARADGPPKPDYNPATLGNAFNNQQFVAQGNAMANHPEQAVGMIGVEQADGSLEITSCQGLKSDAQVNVTAVPPTPAFNALVDKNWGLSASFLGLSLNLGGSSEVNVSGVATVNASVSPVNFLPNLSGQLSACNIPSGANAYVIGVATSYLITSKNFLKGNLGGNLIYVQIGGTNYSEASSSAFYVVAVSAYPIYRAGAQSVVLSNVAAIRAANKQVIGLPNAVVANKLVPQQQFLTVSKVAKHAALNPAALSALRLN
jgi:hypothetical protein